ncbi:hypothetical protein [Gallaecimonas sp. GXIMD4217]|uniref:hypothetical protein n=1 Tax=Gallaecimonas sp. GXIMD4217 TaxID=3131927 RepID=UPI00311B0CA7
MVTWVRSSARVNVVLLRGFNGHDLASDFNWLRETPLTLRLIELMQTGDNGAYFARHHQCGGASRDRLIRPVGGRIADKVGGALVTRSAPWRPPPCVAYYLKQAGPVLGWTSAVAAYIPKVIGFAVFYGVCVFVNWWFYLRKDGEHYNP